MLDGRGECLDMHHLCQQSISGSDAVAREWCSGEEEARWSFDSTKREIYDCLWVSIVVPRQNPGRLHHDFVELLMTSHPIILGFFYNATG